MKDSLVSDGKFLQFDMEEKGLFCITDTDKALTTEAFICVIAFQGSHVLEISYAGLVILLKQIGRQYWICRIVSFIWLL